jgi:hypothetical protein
MSINEPLFLRLEEFAWQGCNTGLYFNLHVHANRTRVARQAAETIGCDLAAARRLAFATWLAEFRCISEDPDVQPRPVRIACPGGIEGWWQHRQGFSTRDLKSGVATPAQLIRRRA